jgi:hypothetical protein
MSRDFLRIKHFFLDFLFLIIKNSQHGKYSMEKIESLARLKRSETVQVGDESRDRSRRHYPAQARKDIEREEL